MPETCADGSGRFLPECDCCEAKRSRWMLLIFFLLGLTVLYPWNALLNALGYMDNVMFKNKGWAVVLPPAFNGTTFFVQLLGLIAGELVEMWKVLAVMLPFGVGSAILCMYCIAQGESFQHSYEASLACCVGIAVVVSICQAYGGELTSKIIDRYSTAPVLYGNGIAFAGIFSLCAFGGLSAVLSDEAAVYGVFVFTALLFMLTMLALAFLYRRGELRSASSTAPCPKAVAEDVGLELAAVGAPPAREPSMAPLSRRDAMARLPKAVARAWRQELNLFVLYVETFLVFPLACLGFVPPSDVQPADYGFRLTSAFQIADFGARFILLLLPSFPDGPRVWMSVAARSLGLPLFYLCWRQPHGLSADPLVHSALVVLWGLSNGMITTFCFVAGAKDASAADQPIVGRALPVFLGFGILTGSFLASSIFAELE
eukprot:TRINITY_DN30253_c0_g1_i1.p1 TRINITY_DN30253_c0_g1~~TRINITY_DN30253_c0_g1_i1.p1  ORF type:complete len:429 (+),score=76.69 TRINITY_DN30253_c0_g1_i1:71-1357(+)